MDTTSAFKPWSPFHLARRLFKPVPSLSPRADQLANRRAWLGLALVTVLSWGVREPVDIVKNDVFSKALGNAIGFVILLAPLSILFVFLITRSGTRASVGRGVGKLFQRLTVWTVAVVGSFALYYVLLVTNPAVPQWHWAVRVCVMGPPPLWLVLLWLCGLYWITRTIVWIGEVHPLVPPVLTIYLAGATFYHELTEGDTKGLSKTVWLVIVLTACASTVVVAFREYREVRAHGVGWRTGPRPPTPSSPSEHERRGPTPPPDSGYTIAMPQPPVPPPETQGWYPDPLRPTGSRWWDGSSWTDHVR